MSVKVKGEESEWFSAFNLVSDNSKGATGDPLTWGPVATPHYPSCSCCTPAAPGLPRLKLGPGDSLKLKQKMEIKQNREEHLCPTKAANSPSHRKTEDISNPLILFHSS